MFEISQEDRDVMDMCHENRRRSGMTTVVGYIVPASQAEDFARFRAAEKHRDGGVAGTVMMAMGTLAVIALSIAALI